MTMNEVLERPALVSRVLRRARRSLLGSALLRDGLLRDGLLRDGLLRDGLLRDGLLRDGLLRDGLLRGGLLAGGLLVAACGNRSDEWDAEFASRGSTVALSGAVAVLDESLNRVLFLSVPGDGQLDVQAEDVGRNVAALAPSADGERLMVLSAGVVPRQNPEDEPPQLLVFEGGASAKKKARLVKSFQLDDPMQNLSLDPQGEWVLAFAGAATVTNLNELVLCNLRGSEKKGEPVSKTIRSFGGAPVDVVFTDTLLVPQGSARRFLAVRTDRDVALIDLSDLAAEEITIPLPESANGTPFAPAEIVYDDGDPDDPEDARLAIRLTGSSDVVIVQLAAPEVAGRDFSVVMNIVDVGGQPTAIDFVRTDGGLRLAALVPSRLRATLINPETTLAEVVELPRPYDRMRRITADVDQDARGDGDVALLWGTSNSIAFWTLGQSSSTPYRSLDTTELSFPVSEVLDVPAPHQHLKVLRSAAGSGLYLLDLSQRQSFPFQTEFSSPQVRVAPDGERLWVYQQGYQGFSAVRLSDLHPKQLTVTPGADNVFDIEQAKDGRAALILHQGAGLSATLFSADEPDSTATKFFTGLQLGDLQ